MPYCSNCGTKLDDSAAFCQTCGIPVGSAQPKAQPAPTPPTALGVLKQTVASPLFLTSSITFTIAAAMNIIVFTSLMFLIPAVIAALYMLASTLGAYAAADAIGKFYELDLVQALQNDAYFENIFTASLIGAFIVSIPSILCAIGMWMTYAQGKSKHSDKFSTAGLTIMQVVTIMGLVSVCLLIAPLAIASLVGCFAFPVSPAGTILGVIPMFMAFIADAVTATLAVIYYAKLLKMIRSMKAIARGTASEGYASRYVAVCCFIAAYSELSMLPLAIAFFPAFTLLLCAGVASICLGVVILRYRSNLNKLNVQNFTL